MRENCAKPNWPYICNNPAMYPPSFDMKLLSTSILALVLLTASLSAQTVKTVDNSLNAGKVEWLSRQINAGDVPFGAPVSRDFELKNVSTENLMILQVKSGCHCTVAEFSKEPVAPGQSTTIKVTYDGQKEGEFYRIVTVVTNFDTAQSVPLILTGKVLPNPEASIKN